MTFSKDLAIIEQNHLSHFKFLPKALGFDVNETRGMHVINCGFGSSMFNIVYGVPADGDLDVVVSQVKDSFKGQSFAWWIPESCKNSDFSAALLEAGLAIETIEHAMICDLKDFIPSVPKTNLVIKEVLDQALLEDFIAVLEPYDDSVRSFHERINNSHLRSSEKLFVGYAEGKAVTIAILFVSVTSAGIFSLLTNEEAQGKGYGADMMAHLLYYAKCSGSLNVTLSASSDSGYRIYERLGFKKVGEFECFEYKIGKKC